MQDFSVQPSVTLNQNETCGTKWEKCLPPALIPVVHHKTDEAKFDQRGRRQSSLQMSQGKKINCIKGN